MTGEHHYFKGILGAAAPFGGVAFSILAEVEIWMRLLALLIGIVTSILYGIHLWHKIKEQRKGLRENISTEAPRKPRPRLGD